MVRKSNDGSISDGTGRLRRRADERRREILRAAGRVFRRRGVAAAGMREIAAEAELSPSNLYHYFDGKQQILCVCQELSLERMLGALRQARRSERNAHERLADVVRAHVLCMLDEIEGAAAHLEIEALPEPLRRRIVARRDRYERGVRGLIADGVAAGEFAPCEPTLVTRAILGALNWTARWFHPDGRHTAAEVADSMADYLVRGLTATGAAERTPRVAHAGGRR
ncbi:MAG TPA: TetR/AcrR family transcriptional regulator [Gaiellaceae bacterium]|nr:TetR/AcrR family transcriptional regulator [Gaiellaceae bacterium]